MSDLARDEFQDDFGYEILNGNIVNMSPASSGHTTVIGNLHAAMHAHFRGKPCRVFLDGLSIHFSQKDKPVPDLTVICKPEIVRKDGAHGTPDLVVEVLSPSTALNDRGYKKELYQHHGVREYWIVDPRGCSVEVHQLIEGKLVLQKVYVRHLPDELPLLTEEEQENLPKSVQSCIFPDLSISLADIFEYV